MVIYDAKNLNQHWTAYEIPGTKYGLSEKGWITSERFEGLLVEHFLEHAVSCRPLLLLHDGHSTHYQPDVIRLGDDNIATSDGGIDVCDNLSSDESDGILLGDNLPDSEHPLRTALFDSEQEESFQRRFDEGYNLR